MHSGGDSQFDLVLFGMLQQKQQRRGQ